MITTTTAAGGATQFAFVSEFRDLRNNRSKHRANTIAFITSGAITSWALSLLNEDGVAVATIASGTTATYYLDTLAPLPVTDDGQSYQLGFVTVGMISAGTLTIDSQTVLTGST